MTKQKKELTLSLEDFEGIGSEHNPSDYLTNPDNIGKAIVECLQNNDPEGVMEVKRLKQSLQQSKEGRGRIISAADLDEMVKDAE